MRRGVLRPLGTALLVAGGILLVLGIAATVYGSVVFMDEIGRAQEAGDGSDAIVQLGARIAATGLVAAGVGLVVALVGIGLVAWAGLRGKPEKEPAARSSR